MTQKPVQCTVTATVLSRAEAKDGYKLELDIPEFGSSYPTLVTRVPAELATALTIGQSYSLVLEQQRLKPGKDGSKPYDYYWGLVGRAVPTDAPQPSPGPVPRADGAHTSSDGPTALPDHPSKRASIERQTSLEIAERFYSRYATEDGLSIAEHSTRLLLLAGKLAQWVATGKAPVLPAETSTATPAPIEAGRPASATHRGIRGPAGAVSTGQSGDSIPEDDEVPF